MLPRFYRGPPRPPEGHVRTVIYARYSSHLQNSRSTADQIAA
jgi:hypothetical protein